MNIAIRSFYEVTTKIKETLLSDINVKTVTIGDITEIDLSKQTIFPLSHIIINNVSSDENTLTYNISILSMDIVDISKSETTDLFVGNDNEQDVFNTQLKVANTLIQKMRIGSIYREKYQIIGAVEHEPFVDRFENQLAGWATTFDLIVENDISVC